MKEIIINNIVGAAAPFNIFLCDDQTLNCFWIATTNVIPFTFMIPPPYNNLSNVCVKVVDSNNCEITECVDTTIV